ncbi:MAG: hypothetical protein Q7T18_02030, partial [Sedimentisphaerales bacterium]|nr:hypothetical protein [Sedimentisphaerales bacterium]
MPAIHKNYAAGDKIRAQPPGGFEPNSSGMVLVVVVILAAVAGILSAGLHFAGGSRITQVRQEMRFEKAFFVAEAGIESAKSELLDSATNLNGVLANGGVLFGGFTPYGEGGFYAWVRNNTNFDPNPLVNTSYIMIIRSTGTVETATRVIEVELKVVPTLAYTSMPTEADSAFSIYGSNTTLNVKGDSKIDGNDWNLPYTLVSTNYSVSTNPAQPGVLYTSPSTVIDTNKSDSIVGDPPTTNAAGEYDEAYWLQFTETMMSSAITYTNGSLGTRAAPIITLLPSGLTTLNGTVSGVGILIVPGDATL